MTHYAILRRLAILAFLGCGALSPAWAACTDAEIAAGICKPSQCPPGQTLNAAGICEAPCTPGLSGPTCNPPSPPQTPPPHGTPGTPCPKGKMTGQDCDPPPPPQCRPGYEFVTGFNRCMRVCGPGRTRNAAGLCQ